MVTQTKESTELTNFHPISVLPVLSKILERVVCEQLISYLLKHNLLYEQQSGFRPHKMFFYMLLIPGVELKMRVSSLLQHF